MFTRRRPSELSRGVGQIYQLHWEKQQQKANREMLELLEMLEERAQIENIEMCQRNNT